MSSEIGDPEHVLFRKHQRVSEWLDSKSLGISLGWAMGLGILTINVFGAFGLGLAAGLLFAGVEKPIVEKVFTIFLVTGAVVYQYWVFQVIRVSFVKLTPLLERTLGGHDA